MTSSSLKLSCINNLGFNIFSIDQTIGLSSTILNTFTNTTPSINSSTASFIISGGGLSISSINSSSHTSGGALTIEGGAAISKDIHIGGSLYIQGTNLTPITSNQLIGPITTTGIYKVNITFPKILSNTSYKITGSLSTISNIPNVYSLTFSNLTTSSCVANIYRVDALGSGENDANLTLSYIIFP